MAWSAFFLPYIEETAIDEQLDLSKDLLDEINRKPARSIISTYLCPSSSKTEKHRHPSGYLKDIPDDQGGGFGCVDYLGISGPGRKEEDPFGKDYGRNHNHGVLISLKGLPSRSLVPPAIRTEHIKDGLSKTICVAGLVQSQW